MKAYIFFSVHEELFRRVAELLQDRYVDAFSGFVWGHNQERAIEGHGVTYDPLVIFTRDLLPKANDRTPPDIPWLERRERELGISIQRMIASERHLLAGRTFEQILRLAEVALREVAAAYDRIQPDMVFSEDVSCLHSYIHFVLARERGIPFWCIGSGRIPNRLAVYSAGMQHWDRVEKLYPELVARGLTVAERREAEDYVARFRERPVRPTGMDVRSRPVRIELADVSRFRVAAARYFGDRDDPTMVSPLQAIRQRLRRLVRERAAAARHVFERPVAGEQYVLYPIHYQPEATTLVQAPLYVDQLALIQDMAKCLPVGHRLYIKEHMTNRGRRPVSFYEALHAIPAVRLLGPDEDTWALIRGASVIAVITGTMGWEGLLFDKPVVTFGDVFFNLLPHVHRAGLVAKDRWYDVFKRAATSHLPDRDALLALISAIQQSSYPGFMGNSRTFPEVLLPENVAHVADALVREAGLRRSTAAVG